MSGGLTDAAEVDILKMMTGQATTIWTTTPLTNVYCALTLTVPTDSAAGTEVTGGSYARVQTVGKWSTSPSGAGGCPNTVAITFPTPTADWGTVVGFELWTASSGGTRIAHGTTPIKVVSNGGAAPSFPIGSLVIYAN